MKFIEGAVCYQVVLSKNNVLHQFRRKSRMIIFGGVIVGKNAFSTASDVVQRIVFHLVDRKNPPFCFFQNSIVHVRNINAGPVIQLDVQVFCI